LEGLEIKDVNYSATYGNKDFRIDSDFWTKEPRKNLSLKYEKIGSILKSAQYGISVSMNENNVGFPIYRMNEIHNMMCDLDVNKNADISKDEFSKFKLNDRDVLFNRTNSYEWVGRTGIYRKVNETDFTFASYLVRFIPKEEFILPEYLTTFLNTKYGVWDIKRRSRQSVNQTNVNPEEVKEILIPILRKDLQNILKSNFDKANLCRIKSIDLYSSAEKLLLEAIGLKNLKVNPDFANVKSFKESFLATGRLDAEYYQKKYEDYTNLICNYKNGSGTIQKGCNLADNNFNPKDDIEYKYIELSNIGKSGEIQGCTKDKGKDLPSRARRRVTTNDVIISSIEGSLDSCALVTDEYNFALCSTGFYVINSSKINSETLLVLFKSEPMQNILKQNCSGTILTAINKNEFLNMPVPLIEEPIQNQIKAKIRESFRLRKESEQLLETARRAVEIAIEVNEYVAMEYIHQNTKNFKPGTVGAVKDEVL
jgi:restriction endonuclease S subunit